MAKDLGMEGKERLQFAEQERKRDEEKQREKRQHDKEIKKMELEILEKTKLSHDASLTVGHAIKGPKLPLFDEERDKLDSYLERFERYSTAQGWSNDDKAIFLGSLLRGKSLDVYSRLPADESSDYEKLKQALLKAFQLTEEGFRRKFYTGTETPAQYIFRLETYFDRWIDMSAIKHNYDDLHQVILRKQFLSEIPRELSIYLRERNPKTMKEICKLSESYMEARGWSRLIKKSNLDKPKGENQSTNHSANKPKQSFERRPIECFLCHKTGHIARNCPRERKTVSSCLKGNKLSLDPEFAACITGQEHHLCSINDGKAYLKCGCSVPMLGSFCCKHLLNTSSLPIADGFVEGIPVKVMRDTGCNSVVVKRSLISDTQLTGVNQKYVMIDRSMRTAPLAKFKVCSPFFTGEVEALCLDNPIFDVIIGNIPNATMGVASDSQVSNSGVDSTGECVLISSSPVDVTATVKTCSQTNQTCTTQKPLNVSNSIQTGINAKQLVKLQTNDKLLNCLHIKCANDMSYKTPHGTVRFGHNKGLMYRYFVSNQLGHEEVKQLIVPRTLQHDVLILGHEAVMSGHLGIGKTRKRILSNFYWPQISADISCFCQSCDKCQKTIPRGCVTKVPLQRMPFIDTPFQRVDVDIIGPIEPRSTGGFRYILTLVDFATRYPEAQALASIDTETVAEALMKMFSRIGVPKEILSDNGSQLTSKIMAEVARLLSIDQLFTSPYHAMCNGLCEKMNGTLKQMLRKICLESLKEWDRYIEPLLFAYRDVPQDSTGFSSFELMYGRSVRGPMTVLRELWTKENLNEDIKTTYEYVFDLRNKLEEMLDLAHSNLTHSQSKYKKYYDRKYKPRTLEPGLQGLVLLPTKPNKLLMQWRGPYLVTEKVGLNDYKIQMGSKVKLFHINMMKQYHRRDPPHEINVIAALDSDVKPSEFNNDQLLTDYPLTHTETFKDVNINPDLTNDQKLEISTLIEKYCNIFSSKPGLTKLVEHDFKIDDHKHLHLKPYPIPHAMLETVKQEIRDMAEMGIIEPANSPYRFPLLLVKKRDGSCRPVIDFIKLNKITTFDAEPMNDIEQIFAKATHSNFLSKLDFAKGYWQIKLKEEVREYTAFYSPLGSFHFCRMPFGLVNAGSSYNLMIRLLLEGVDHVENFVDDVLAHNDDWSSHMASLRTLFSRIQQANLTVKPSKCYFGYSKLEYVGPQLGSGRLSALSDKISHIRDAARPRTKTELRAFLGLSGFYHRYVPNYSAIACYLTDLIKKGRPNRLVWEDCHQVAFETLTQRLCNAPILKLPDFNKDVVIRADASQTAIGAVLLQDHDGMLCPVVYASKKLQPSELSYSVIEKECFSIIWAIKKFMLYIYGKQFVLQTDHQPLAFLDRTKKVDNSRVMRWALFLQPLNFRVEIIKGKDNVGADYLSRTKSCED